MTVQIAILAMVAVFLGLRLFAVLGRRSEHEEEVIVPRFDTAPLPKPAVPRGAEHDSEAADKAAAEPSLQPKVEKALRDITHADRKFDLDAFVEGACGAYKVILEAFWQGDKDALAPLCDPAVLAEFNAAIDARTAAGEVLENRLVRIEQAAITDASYAAPLARITVKFTADIAAITRDAKGTVIAGSLNDAVVANDVWSFTRNVTSASPDWVLDETDAE